MSEAEDASGKGSNLTAVEAISARLAEVTRLAEKLDARLCEAGARTRPVPMSSSAMSSTSSLVSSSSAPTSQVQSVSSGGSITATTSTIGVTTPLISSSVSTVQLQPKCVSTILTSFGNESVLLKEPSVTSNGSVCTNDKTVVENGKEEEKIVEKEIRETEMKQDDRLDEDVIEKSLDESLAEDSNIDDYVTATECSITPTARSRSESFAMGPECEDFPVQATLASTNDAWNIEEPKCISTDASSPAIKQIETLKESKIEKEEKLMDVPNSEVSENCEEKQIDKLVSMEKTVEEKSGKIVKEVTETTTLRVSHDIRLDVASYKVTSNTLQDHRENVDVTEIKDLERLVTPDVYENGVQSDQKSESYSRRDELSTKTDDATERVIKFAKVCELNLESRIIPVDTSKEITLSLKEYTRHHEDSGIEMSPTKKDENLEGQDFLERARKVSSIETSSMNGDRTNSCCCSCDCSHEAARFDRFSMQQNLLELSNENRCRMPQSNAS